MSPLHDARRRYAERAAAETATSTPAVGHQRASDKRIQISAAEADAMIEREATQHTPGPWTFRAQETRLDFGVIEAADDDGRFTVATLGGHLSGAYGKSGEAMANARLIEAAPDLLDALIHVMGPYPTEEGLARARAAIRKAKGNA